ncbi:MAG: LamG-like jellyroll fold domain-containing protein [Planctomycetia bacterium]|nr:LamG-like jellyroll fold domain-containing protein [Planctomycetia bacterium]
MLTRLVLGMALCAMTISTAHAAIYDDLNENYAELFGLGAHWVGSDYTSGNWVDRTTGKVATSNGTVSQDATTQSVSFDGGYFTVAAADNPLAGVQNYTILVNFTPEQAGAGNNTTAWYQCTGLVDMEMPGIQNDWGLEYNGAGQIVAGIGMPGSADYQSRSASTVTLNQSSVVGARLNGTSLAAVFDGSAESAYTLPTTPAVRNSSGFRIGRCATNNNEYHGLIREVRMFNRALNTSELKYYSAEMANDFEAVEYGQVVTNPAHTLITVTSGTAAMEFTDTTLPAGIAVGGGTATASATLSGANLHSINMTYLLPNGNLTIQTPQSGFANTLNILGGTLDTSSGTFSTASDARVIMTGGNWNGQAVTLGGQTVFQMTGGTMTLSGTNTWQRVLTIDTPFAVIHGGTVHAGEVNLGNNASGTLLFQSGTISIANTNIGRYNTGNFFQEGGNLTVTNYFSMGDQSSGSGYYELSNNGTLNASIGAIGNRGSGSYLQKSGTATFRSLNVGHDGGNANSGGAGSMELRGGTLTVTSRTIIGQPIANSSRATNTQGYFLQSGGTFMTPTLTLGNQMLTGKTTIFDLTDGTLKAGTISGYTNLLNLTGGILETQRVDGDLTNRGSTLRLLDGTPTTITGNFQQLDGKIAVELSSDLAQNYVLTANSFDFGTTGGVELIFDPDELLPGMEIDITLATPNSGYDWLPQLISESDWGYYFFSDFNAGTGTLHLAVNSGAIPEPSTWLMLCLGIVGLVSWKKRNLWRKKA